MGRQLALGLRSDTFPTFDAFLPEGNREALLALREAVKERHRGVIYIWGPRGSGKTHLLQAACIGGGSEGIYLPLAEMEPRVPGVLEGLESRNPVCLDDLGAVTGGGEWEESLFHLFNRAQAAGTLLVLAGRAPPRGLGIVLPDLLSRLVGGLVLQVQAPTDEQLVAIIASMARRRGMQISDDALRYLLSRERRELGYLATILERLDAVSMAAQRRVTIPLIKRVLAE